LINRIGWGSYRKDFNRLANEYLPVINNNRKFNATYAPLKKEFLIRVYIKIKKASWA
jgi:hypothetical protein